MMDAFTLPVWLVVLVVASTVIVLGWFLGQWLLIKMIQD